MKALQYHTPRREQTLAGKRPRLRPSWREKIVCRKNGRRAFFATASVQKTIDALNADIQYRVDLLLMARRARMSQNIFHEQEKS